MGNRFFQMFSCRGCAEPCGASRLQESFSPLLLAGPTAMGKIVGWWWNINHVILAGVNPIIEQDQQPGSKLFEKDFQLDSLQLATSWNQTKSKNLLLRPAKASDSPHTATKSNGQLRGHHHEFTKFTAACYRNSGSWLERLQQLYTSAVHCLEGTCWLSLGPLLKGPIF